MRQILVNHKDSKVMLEDVPPPLCTDYNVLIQVHNSLISTGTETASFKNAPDSYVKKAVTNKEFRDSALNYIKSQGIKKSMEILKGSDVYSPTGYSGSGTVIDVGKNVKSVNIGDRVAYGGINHAEIVCAPENYVVKMPDSVSFQDAAFTTLGSIAMQSVRRAKVELGEKVLVIGLGLVGQLVNQLLLSSGCHTIGSDLSEKRIKLAKELGLEKGIGADENLVEAINKYTYNTGIDAVIICAQSKSSNIVNQAMQVCRERGRVIVVGDVGLDVERRPFYQKELNLLISRAYGPGCYDDNYVKKGQEYPFGHVRWTANRNMEEFIIQVGQGRVNVGKLTSKVFDIKNAQQAYDVLLENNDDILAVLMDYKVKKEKSIKTVIELEHSTTVPKVKNNINCAIIGTGGICTGFHLPNLEKNKGATIYAIVSGTGIKAKRIAKQYNAKYCTTDYKDVLKDKNVHCVLIATHHHLHKQMIIDAAESGKHVFVEKPMAMNYEDIKEIIETVKKTGIIFTIGTNRRFSPISQIAKDIIQKRGKPVLINYKINTTQLPLGHWVNDPIEGGGRVIGESPHFFDLMYWLLDSEPIRIYAESVETKSNSMLKENNIVSTIKFSDGSIGSLSYCDFGSNNFPREVIEIIAGGTVVQINNFRNIKTSDGFQKKFNFLNVGFHESLEHFIEALQGKRALELDLKDGTRSTICALKVLDSLNSGKTADINLNDFIS